jgi:hypothetical protein
VDLPLPVSPVIRTIPLLYRGNCIAASGRPSDSIFGMLLLRIRIAAERDPCERKRLIRTRSPAIVRARSHSPGFADFLCFRAGQRSRQFFAVLRGQDFLTEILQFPVDPDLRRKSDTSDGYPTPPSLPRSRPQAFPHSKKPPSDSPFKSLPSCRLIYSVRSVRIISPSVVVPSSAIRSAFTIIGVKSVSFARRRNSCLSPPDVMQRRSALFITRISNTPVLPR